MLDIYANRTAVQHTESESIITFGLQLPPVGNSDGATKAVVRVVMPWSVARELVAALADGLAHAERVLVGDEVQP